MSTNLELINLPKLLKIERNKRFMTFKDVAEGVDLSTSYIFRIEKGERKPSHSVINKLICFFGLSEEELDSYIDVKSENEMVMKEDMLQFISNMNCNDLTHVNYLLDQIKKFQETIFTKDYNNNVFEVS